MQKRIETPDFKDESEEALWWEQNQGALLNEFQQAAKDGSLGRATITKRGQTPAITIRLDPSDVEMARAQAQERGLRYQTYLKMVIHQALMREAER